MSEAINFQREFERALAEEEAVSEAIKRVRDAAPDLLAAAKKLEEAEAFHLACEECEGQEQPEICGHCFPLYDDARVMRRNAIAKAEGAKP